MVYRHVEIKINGVWRTLYDEIRINEQWCIVEDFPTMPTDVRTYLKIYFNDPVAMINKVISSIVYTSQTATDFISKINGNVLIKISKINMYQYTEPE